MPSPNPVERLYDARASRNWKARLARLREPPLPLIRNPHEPADRDGGAVYAGVPGEGK